MSAVNEVLIAGLSSAALSGALGSYITARATRPKIVAETDSIIVAGAETTVQSALAVAAAEAARADRAEAENTVLRARLDAALAKVDALQAALDMVRDELRDIKNSTDH